jgi:hypothetical protein
MWVAALLIALCGCTQYIVKIPEKNVDLQVNTFFEDKEIDGLEWVWSDGSYFSVDKSSSKVDQEGLAMLQLLISSGMIQPPVTPLAPSPNP